MSISLLSKPCRYLASDFGIRLNMSGPSEQFLHKGTQTQAFVIRFTQVIELLRMFERP